ncbi:helix-loop-helix domain containing protein 2 [Dermatophagoides farinae]|nr:helix-loop-helix domain containing protein 2 [Dermatophagoides farinae]
MPVKINYNSNNRYSPLPASSSSSFDMFFNEDFSVDPTDIDVTDITNSFCFEEIWSNFIPTPPQSPPFILDCCEDLLNDEKMHLDEEIGKNVIAHDCMWSGQCSEHKCKSSTYSLNGITNMNSNNNSKSMATFFRPGTPFNLSTSPQSAFNYIHSCDLNMNENYTVDDDNNQQQHDQQQQQQSSNTVTSGNVYAMTNDHSYGSSQQQQQQQKITIMSDLNEKSLIHKDTKSIYRKPMENKSIGQPRMSKMRCKKLSNSNRKHQQQQQQTSSSSSLLNNNAVSSSNVSIINGIKKENQNSVIKTTLVSSSSSSNIKNFQPLKRKNPNTIVQHPTSISTSSNLSRVIHVKNLATTSSAAVNLISNLQLNSPACSDSEESSLSFLSGDGCEQKLNGGGSSPPVKRREHNDSERKRRDHLRNSFNNLRDQIPKLKTSQKRPPRIMILHEATNYVQDLIHENEQLEHEHRIEIEKRNRLMEILRRCNESST